DDVALPAVLHLVTLGQVRHGLEAPVEGVESLEDLRADLPGDRRRGHVSIQGGRLSDHRHAKNDASLRRAGRRSLSIGRSRIQRRSGAEEKKSEREPSAPGGYEALSHG